MRYLLISSFTALSMLLSAVTASAFTTSIEPETGINPGDTVDVGQVFDVFVDFDTDGVGDVSLLSVSVLFDSDIVRFIQSSAESATYALYTGGKGASYLKPALTNNTIRVGTVDQTLQDWQNNVLPGGAEASGAFQMAALPFQARLEGTASFTLSNSSPGNVLFLGDGSSATNNLIGDFTLTVPEPTSASLSIAALLTLAGIRMRSRKS
ncbi:MAG: hypothetical protein CL917_16655 [Deltaproteobacteria bacterium]|nr:hypothetical protein [Deltaproteobacteria bacterium]